MRYSTYRLLKELIEAMVKKDETMTETLKEELKRYLTNEEFDGKEFAYDLIEVMYEWAEELGKARRFKSVLLDFISDAFDEVYETIENRMSYLDERIDRAYRRCDY